MKFSLLPFQRRFLRGALAPGTRTAALSIPRGNGKSTLVAWLAKRALTPGDELFVSGAESHIVARSINQARTSTFKLLRELIGEDRMDTTATGAEPYRVAENKQHCQIVHRETNTRVTVLPSSGKSAQGLVRCPWLFADEPGSWDAVGGTLLHEAIETSHGKIGSRLRVIYIGTIWPSNGGWWPELVQRGTTGSKYVLFLAGDPSRWDQASEIRRVNPLMWSDAGSRSVLLEERNEAKRDTRLKALFCGARLNVPTADEAKALLQPEEWELVLGRDVPPAAGLPIVGLDMGGNRAWTAGVGVWESGRIEALALVPGIPNVATQERRDRVPKGTYQRLVDSGSLVVATGLRQPPAVLLVDEIVRRWGGAAGVVCDRHRLTELQDAAPGWGFMVRVPGWENATEDIRGLRRQAADGTLAVANGSRALLTWSMGAAIVKPDERANIRLVKQGTANTSRDDVAQGLILAVGALDRWLRSRPAGGGGKCF